MFTCKECNKIYTYKANYIRHINIKHKQMTENTDINSDTESDFIYINSNYFNKEEYSKDHIIEQLKKQVENYTLEYNTLKKELERVNVELSELKEKNDNQLLHYFMKYKLYTTTGTVLFSKPFISNKLFLKK